MKKKTWSTCSNGEADPLINPLSDASPSLNRQLRLHLGNFDMAGTRQTRFETANPTFPMVNLENGVAKCNSPTQSSSASSSPVLSPTETAYLTHTDHVEGLPPHSKSAKNSSLLQCLPWPSIEPCETFAAWVKGPQLPRQCQIKPIFERLQTAPTRLLYRISPKYPGVLMLCGYCILWLLLFVVTVHRSNTTGEIGRYAPPIRLSCISRLW